MATAETKIQWTDRMLAVEACVHEIKRGQQLIAEDLAVGLELVQPRVQIHVTLAAVAASTRWRDVAGGCSSASSNWIQVVDGVRRAAAVDAAAIVHIPQMFSTDRWHSIHAAAPTCNSVPAAVAVVSVRCIPSACICVAVLATLAVTHLSNAAPGFAVGTPAIPNQLPCTPLTAAGARRAVGRHPTGKANRVESVSASSVLSKLMSAFPLRAVMAVLLAKEYVSRVFSDADSKSLRGDLGRSVRRLTHLEVLV